MSNAQSEGEQVLAPKPAALTPVSEIMSRQVIAVTPDLGVDDFEELLMKKGISRRSQGEEHHDAHGLLRGRKRAHRESGGSHGL
jgi:CBS domain-containing protein